MVQPSRSGHVGGVTLSTACAADRTWICLKSAATCRFVCILMGSPSSFWAAVAPWRQLSGWLRTLIVEKWFLGIGSLPPCWMGAWPPTAEASLWVWARQVPGDRSCEPQSFGNSEASTCPPRRGKRNPLSAPALLAPTLRLGL